MFTFICKFPGDGYLQRFTGANQHRKVEIPDSGNSKTKTLSEIGIDIRRANETEKIAKIEEVSTSEVRTLIMPGLQKSRNETFAKKPNRRRRLLESFLLGKVNSAAWRRGKFYHVS